MSRVCGSEIEADMPCSEEVTSGGSYNSERLDAWDLSANRMDNGLAYDSVSIYSNRSWLSSDDTVLSSASGADTMWFHCPCPLVTQVTMMILVTMVWTKKTLPNLRMWRKIQVS